MKSSFRGSFETRYTEALRGMTFCSLLLFAIAWSGMKAYAAPKPPDRKAASEKLLLQGHIDEAIASLDAVLATTPGDGEANLLLCRAYYAEEHPDEAIAACDNAVLELTNSSAAFDWLGRAYGMKADRSGPLAGFKLAHKVDAAFEQALKLDPNFGAAVNDLGEYYISAPSVLGGGNEKAVDLAEHSAAKLPQEAHRIQALAAEKRHDFGTADREFRAAVEVANKPDAMADLGAYLFHRKQEDEAVEVLKRCIAADKAKDDALVDAASILTEMHREPQLAIQALNLYLAGNAHTDAAPIVKVYVLLGKLLAASGDKAGAKIDFEKALQLAANYTPAKRALQEL
jgi:tetratricopeptide (TPR) repeat protein